ncbi:MAG: hypothetical protein U1E76_27235 [Planctomycetota bacterium]
MNQAIAYEMACRQEPRSSAAFALEYPQRLNDGILAFELTQARSERGERLREEQLVEQRWNRSEGLPRGGEIASPPGFPGHGARRVALGDANDSGAHQCDRQGRHDGGEHGAQDLRGVALHPALHTLETSQTARGDRLAPQPALEVPSESACVPVAPAFLGIGGKAYDCVEIAIDVGNDRRQRFDSLGHRPAPIARVARGEQVVHGESQAVDIGARVDRCADDLLGCRIRGRCPRHGPGGGRCEGTDQTKIHQDRGPFQHTVESPAFEHDVLRLHIPMHEPALVQHRKRLRHFVASLHHAPSIRAQRWTVPEEMGEHIGEGWPFDHAHGIKQNVALAILATVVHGHQVRVMQRRCDPSLADEAVAIALRQRSGRDDLERDRSSAQTELARSVHFARPAARQEGLDLEARHALAPREPGMLPEMSAKLLECGLFEERAQPFILQQQAFHVGEQPCVTTTFPRDESASLGTIQLDDAGE